MRKIGVLLVGLVAVFWMMLSPTSAFASTTTSGTKVGAQSAVQAGSTARAKNLTQCHITQTRGIHNGRKGYWVQEICYDTKKCAWVVTASYFDYDGSCERVTSKSASARC